MVIIPIAVNIFLWNNGTREYTEVARSFAAFGGSWYYAPGYYKAGQTKFTVYCHKDFNFACGLVVIIQISNQYWVLVSYARTSKSPRSHPLIRALGGWGSKCCMFTVLNLKSEKIWKSMRVVTINSEFSLPPPQYNIILMHVYNVRPTVDDVQSNNIGIWSDICQIINKKL